MTAVSNRESKEPAPRCPQCGAFGEFGYRDVYGAMGWFCARHRLAQFWADARIAIFTNNKEVLTYDNDHQQIDRAAAEPAAGSYPADGLSWDRAGLDVDRPRLVRRPDGTRGQLTAVALDRTPHFDASGRFIHLCSNCGREAVLGARVNLPAGQLGTWYCGACKGPSSLNAGRQPEKPRSATSPTVAGTSVETWPPEVRMSRWIDGVRSHVEAAPAILAKESAP
jgi:hypothetical protein